MEKHYKSVINRNVCDYFFESQSKCSKPEDIPTVIATPHHKLIVIYRNKLYFVAVVTTEGWIYLLILLKLKNAKKQI